jgi:hypothetical protein
MAQGENTNIGTGVGAGAASGALMGTMIAPGVGTAVGAVAGGLMGAMGAMGQNSAAKAQRAALEAQKRAMEAEMRRRATGVANAREAFGDVWSFGKPTGDYDPSKFQNLDKTIMRHGQLAGGIESNAQAVRDAGTSQLTGAGQQAAVAQRGASLDRGLLGSSLDESARKMLLSQYAANRSGVAQATEGARQGGWDAVKGQQQAFESAARGGSDITGQMRSISTASQIAGARSQMPYIMFGNLLSSGMGVLDAGARSEAGGGRGFTALGLPKLGLAGAPDRAVGATTSRGI